MTFCFISGFSQPASILKKLGDSINIEAEKLYFSSSELVGKNSYIENLSLKLKDKQNVILIGWSLGGSIALEYAAQYPVEKLIIISGTACYLKSDNNPDGIEPLRLEALSKGVAQTKEQSLRRFISTVCSPNYSEQEFDKYYQDAYAVPAEILVSNLEYFKNDFRPICTKIQCPTLILHDSEDRVVPVAQGELLSDLIPQAKKYFTSSFGHLVIERHPEILAREIEKLFRVAKNDDSQVSAVESSFSKSASTYDDHSYVQKEIANKLLSLIPNDPTINSILDLGAGTGYLSEKLNHSFPEADLTLADISADMLNVANAKVSKAKLLRLNFDQLNSAQIGKFDLVASSAALHWANSFEKLVVSLSEICSNYLAISIMLYGTLHELRNSRLEIVPNKKPYPELRSLDYYANIIAKHFNLISSSDLSFVHYYQSPELAIEALRKTGVNGGSQEKLTKDEFTRLIELYRNKYGSEKGYPLSFNAGFILASRGQYNGAR